MENTQSNSNENTPVNAESINPSTADNAQTTVQSTQVVTNDGGRVTTRQLLIVILLINIIFVLCIGAFLYKTYHEVDVSKTIIDETVVTNDPSDWNLPEPIASNESESKVDKQNLIWSDNTDYSQYYKNIPQQAGVAWFTHPVLREDIQYVTLKNGYDYQTLMFYQIGTYNNEPIVVADYSITEMGTVYNQAIYYGSASTTIYRLSKYTSDGFLDNVIEAIPVEVDDNTDFLALDFSSVLGGRLIPTSGPTSILSFGKIQGVFANTDYNESFRTKNDKENALYESEDRPKRVYDFIEDSVYGPVYRYMNVNKTDDTALVNFALRSVGGMYVPYKYKPLEFLTDDRVPQITWIDGTKNMSRYRMDGLGSCGGGGPEIAIETVKDADLELVGQTSDGRAVYSIINPTHKLIERVFNATHGKVYTYNENTRETIERTITKGEFISNHGVLVIKNDFGEQMIFTHADYGPQAECAKPVIYLYPNSTTTVSVKLDALITKSEPLYENGWLVTANSDGQIFYQGVQYESLFWDGYGNGKYPELNKGFVVETSKAMDLMTKHLSDMGFNVKEIKDFKTFWQEYLPKTSYTQFSWIGTIGMNELAPLNISPKPDTILRAFVDFKGLEEKKEIEPQPIIKTERNGFTVTEWGGILRK